MQSSPKVLPKQQMAKFGFNGWTLWALCITGLVMVPILTVATLALFPTENIWPHLLNTTLPRYFRTTVYLMVSVGLGAAVVGTVTAWLIARYRFLCQGGWNWRFCCGWRSLPMWAYMDWWIYWNMQAPCKPHCAACLVGKMHAIIGFLKYDPSLRPVLC